MPSPGRPRWLPHFRNRPQNRPRHPADLASHACFVYTNTANPEVWRFRRAGGEEAAVRIDGPIRTDSGDAMLPALRAGLR